MPIYEYHSPDTNKIYQFFSPAVIENNLVPTCPDGKNFKMNKIISNFVFTQYEEGIKKVYDKIS